MTSANTCERIMSSATRLFSEVGIAQTSLKDIAGDTQLTVPGVLYYFKTKENLLNELMNDGVRELLAGIDIECKKLSESKDFESFLLAMQSRVRENRLALRIWFRNWGDFSPLRAATGKHLVNKAAMVLSAALGLRAEHCVDLVLALAPLMGRNAWLSPLEMVEVTGERTLELAEARLDNHLLLVARVLKSSWQ